MTKVAVIGLGKLGYPLASVLAQVGYGVIGYDISPDRIQSLYEGLDTSEPDCNVSNIQSLTTDPIELESCEFAFLCVNTPDKEEEMDYTQIESACATLKENFKGKLLVLSTVLPGAARDIIQPLVGNKIEVYSCPVWIALGSVVRDLRNPPAIVIGSDGRQNGIPVLRVFNSITNGSVPPKNVTITDTYTAEMIKLIHNAWCTTKMAFISELGSVSHESGFDIEAVSNFMINGGERSGVFWKYGPPFGGPCFPRDLRYFIGETESDLAKTVYEMNLLRRQEIVDELRDIDPSKRLILLGRSYKYGVAIDEGSVYITIADDLEASGREVFIVDSLDGVDTEEALVVLCHKELQSSIPEDVDYIDLWQVDHE